MSEPAVPAGATRVGIDVVEIAEVTEALAAHPEAYQRRIYTERERADSHGDPRRLAARFAAKEALVKALGEPGGATPPRDVEVVLTDGVPGLAVHGILAMRLHRAGLVVVAVSLTHTDCHAAAVVMLGPAPAAGRLAAG
ncbi:holo-ACP synthase [Enemella evansiae]|uniref:holo-ACP synthase n=1 Tax=Enemella evansiae TaxID=2016499 RepID=UPI000B97374E|nr:holo-ACP synthase [Enemella evansiae]OYO06284.1 ACP synthase [Enemella evansiae]OYO11394.1 ACP synthase [Enemella evansiae]PFG66380.1 holo-[acyl-carrier protein] synthase [Propionibacteriaceae bacterium ES.041]TDO88026.1 holo-[acyl-carrier protein] synthase [Enemella evansiae]